MIVGFSQDHLWCHIFHGPTKCHPWLAVDRKTKIADLDYILAIE